MSKKDWKLLCAYLNTGYSPKQVLELAAKNKELQAGAMTPPVVRCEDCEHYKHFFDGRYFCDRVGGIVHEVQKADFCSYGEKRGAGLSSVSPDGLPPSTRKGHTTSVRRQAADGCAAHRGKAWEE